jgi:hypothetical protein
MPVWWRVSWQHRLGLVVRVFALVVGAARRAATAVGRGGADPVVADAPRTVSDQLATSEDWAALVSVLQRIVAGQRGAGSRILMLMSPSASGVVGAARQISCTDQWPRCGSRPGGFGLARGGRLRGGSRAGRRG